MMKAFGVGLVPSLKEYASIPSIPTLVMGIDSYEKDRVIELLKDCAAVTGVGIHAYTTDIFDVDQSLIPRIDHVFIVLDMKDDTCLKLLSVWLTECNTHVFYLFGRTTILTLNYDQPKIDIERLDGLLSDFNLKPTFFNLNVKKESLMWTLIALLGI